MSGKYQVDTLEKELMTSIDLAILGQRDEIYKRYADGVREEYSFVNDNDYVAGRMKAIDFLLGHKLFLNNTFTKYENRARNNMENEKTRLSSYNIKN